jgi:hypothetical protein
LSRKFSPFTRLNRRSVFAQPAKVHWGELCIEAAVSDGDAVDLLAVLTLQDLYTIALEGQVRELVTLER